MPAENASDGNVSRREGLLPTVVLSQVIGVTTLILMGIWLGSYMGGFAWDGSGKEFNAHPLCMTLSMIYLLGTSSILYRTYPNVEKLKVKVFHALLHGVALVVIIVGLVAVFEFHRANNIANLYSLHSWSGIITVALFFMQYLVGFICFLFPTLNENVRSAVAPFHRYFGSTLLVLSGITAISGINEKLIFSQGKLYQQLQPTALMANFCGLFIIVFIVIVLYILHNSEWTRPVSEENERLVEPKI